MHDDVLFISGRVPALVNRYPGFIYSMAFFASFVSGAGSYQKTCFQKIMSLENSVLADQIRKVYVILLMVINIYGDFLNSILLERGLMGMLS